jgi:hypothetical protein
VSGCSELRTVSVLQAQLEPAYRDTLDVEIVSRGFLDTAKHALARAIKVGRGRVRVCFIGRLWISIRRVWV